MAPATRSSPLSSLKANCTVPNDFRRGSAARRSPSDSCKERERVFVADSTLSRRRQSAPAAESGEDIMTGSSRSSSWSGSRRRFASTPHTKSGLDSVNAAKAGVRELQLSSSGGDEQGEAARGRPYNDVGSPGKWRRPSRPGLPRISTPESMPMSSPVAVLCDPRFEFFCDAVPGRRSHMEDRTIVVPKLAGTEGAALFGVFDGHGGGQVSDLATELMPSFVADSLARLREPASALKDAFLHLDQELLHQSKLVSTPATGFDRMGTTASIVLTVRRGGRLRFFCANAGDSRTVLSRGGVAVDLSRDHKPQDANERRRIEAAGGHVTVTETVGRVDGRLAVSRALGDFMYKDRDDLPPERQKVIALPDVKEVPVGKWDDFVAVGSDGIFGCLTSEELVSWLGSSRRRGLPWERCIKIVLDHCANYAGPEGGDNCSLCVAQLIH